MKLWIRSQDRKTFVKCDDIGIAVDKKYKIVGYFDKNTEYETLGYYISEERAIEVIDDIVYFITKNAYCRLKNGSGELVNIVPQPILIYNMPEE